MSERERGGRIIRALYSLCTLCLHVCNVSDLLGEVVVVLGVRCVDDYHCGRDSHLENRDLGWSEENSLTVFVGGIIWNLCLYTNTSLHRQM